MSESALKFGPEWLRNLSQGTNVSSPPPSPGLGLHAPKFKLAEYRYGREEMLAIFPKDIKMPPDLKQFTGMHKEQYQLPVTLVALTEEEQKIWTRSVNSDAVLRLMGKSTPGAPTGVPAPRGGRGGGSIDRGRGRGRATYFQRGPSLEDGDNPPPGIFTRQRSYERPNSLSDRGAGWEERERRYDKGFASREEEPSAAVRKETSRGNLDWRSSSQRDRERDGEDDGGWRVSGSLRSEKWGRSGWRSERGEREHEDSNAEWPNSASKVPQRKSNSNSRTWNDEHPGGGDLPEWSTEDNRDAESVGTFDATGAFLETKDDRKVKLKDTTIANHISKSKDAPQENKQSDINGPSSPSPEELEASILKSPEPKKTSSPPSRSPHDVMKPERPVEGEPVMAVQTNNVSSNEEMKVNSSTATSRKDSPSPTHKKEEINFEHLEKAAESLVDTWTAEEDEKVEVNHSTTPSLSQWFYRDPQGIVQGPFSDSEMAEWFRTGYFNMSLLVRRGLDGRFCPLGDLVKQWGCVPFLSNNVPVVVQPAPTASSQPPQVSQPVPSVLNDLLGPATVPIEHQNELAVDHDQQLRLLQQQLLQQQLIQQQHLFQQQQQIYLRQQLQQVLGGLKPGDGFSQLSSQQQQQQQQYFLLQRLLSQQQQHPPGVMPRPSVENNAMSDPLRQFMAQLETTQSPSLKDDGQLLWNMQTRNPRADVGIRWPGMHNQPTSVWDLDSMSAPREMSLGQIPPEVLEQEKKLLEEQKKRLNEEEMLRKQEEEKRLRQLEEEEKERIRQEEIRRREEEEERIRREELLLKQQEMEARKQKEAEERRLKEQELRRQQEEEKRRQEEREKEERIRQEHFQRQEEERQRQQREFYQQEEQRKREEFRRQEEEKRIEEEKIKVEHQRELQHQLKLQQQEALKRLQKQQKSKPQAPAWGGQTTAPNNTSLSLTEIQKLQEEKERQERLEWEIQQHLIQQQVQQQQQQAAQQAKAVNLTWANRSNSAGGPVKSLLEIQQEEADKLAQERKKEQQVKKQQQQANNAALAAAGVWSNSNNHLLRANMSPSPWNVENSVANSHSSGFWDDSMPISNGSKAQMPTPNKASDQRYAALANMSMANSNGQAGKSRLIRARKEEETVMKLFEGHAHNVDEFTKWCNQTLCSMQSTIDVPTFVTFLKDVESPYEVYDYVRVYLGESKEAHNFAKQFLEKRSKYRNQDHKKEENMWGPAPAITPSLSKLQQGEMEGPKVAGAKKKKKRMQKLDNTILGFTVHAAMDRVNVGDIDHGEDI